MSDNSEEWEDDGESGEDGEEESEEDIEAKHIESKEEGTDSIQKSSKQPPEAPAQDPISEDQIGQGIDKHMTEVPNATYAECSIDPPVATLTIPDKLIPAIASMVDITVNVHTSQESYSVPVTIEEDASVFEFKRVLIRLLEHRVNTSCLSLFVENKQVILMRLNYLAAGELQPPLVGKTKPGDYKTVEMTLQRQTSESRCESEEDEEEEIEEKVKHVRVAKKKRGVTSRRRNRKQSHHKDTEDTKIDKKSTIQEPQTSIAPEILYKLTDDKIFVTERVPFPSLAIGKEIDVLVEEPTSLLFLEICGKPVKEGIFPSLMYISCSRPVTLYGVAFFPMTKRVRITLGFATMKSKDESHMDIDVIDPVPGTPVISMLLNPLKIQVGDPVVVTAIVNEGTEGLLYRIKDEKGYRIGFDGTEFNFPNSERLPFSALYYKSQTPEGG